MSEVYVFEPNESDLTSFGLVGALEPISCVYEEVANGMSEITMEHPMDEPWGKYLALKEDYLLTVDVPVRMTPEINGTHFVTAVETTTVKNTASWNDRRVWNDWNESNKRRKVIRALKYDTPIVITYARSDRNGYYKIKCTAKGQSCTGWIKSDALNRGIEQNIPDNSAGIEEVAPSWTVQRQIFRIYDVEKGMSAVKVHARHISYDLLTNITTWNEYGEIGMQDALNGMLGRCIAEHGFTAITNMSDTRVGLEYRGWNPIKAILDPEEGITARYNASLVRDNWELTFLKDAGINRGVVIQYGKNLTGIKCTISTENVCTQVVPVGEDKDGNPLTMDYGTYGYKQDVRTATFGETRYCTVISVDHIDDYPAPHIQWVKVPDAKEDTKNGVSKALARKRLYEYAQDLIASGVDVPEVKMTVEFVDLGDTEDYKQYRDLERLFLWDYATVRHPAMDIDKTIRVVKVEYDVLAERMTGIELGAIGETLANTGITTWQIPTGFQGSKIAEGSVSGNAFKDDIIAARHVQAGSIGADAITANSITTEKLAAGAVTADKIAAGAIDVERISADVIESEYFRGSVVDAVRANIGTANIDYAQIKDASVENLFVKDGNADRYYITKLGITNAQIAAARIGQLVLKGDDGKWYEISPSVDSDGNLTLAPVEFSGTVDETQGTAVDANGQQRTIFGEAVNVADLYAANANIAEAIITNLTAYQITATDAFIDKLKVAEINSKGDTITIIAERAESASTTATEAKTEAQTATVAAGSATTTANQAQSTVTALSGSVPVDTVTHYLLSNIKTASRITYDMDGWTEEKPKVTKKLPYLWEYYTYTFYDGSSVNSKISIKGAKKYDFTDVTAEYAVSASDTSIPNDAQWFETLPTLADGQYLWKRLRLTLKSGTLMPIETHYASELMDELRVDSVEDLIFDELDGIGTIWVRSDRPTAAVVNDVWCNVAGNSVWRARLVDGGITWQEITNKTYAKTLLEAARAADIADKKIMTYCSAPLEVLASTSEVESPNDGDICMVASGENLTQYIYSGGSWISHNVNNDIQMVVRNGAYELVTYVQNAWSPVNVNRGDLWLNPNEIGAYRYNGTEWVKAGSDADELQETVSVLEDEFTAQRNRIDDVNAKTQYIKVKSDGLHVENTDESSSLVLTSGGVQIATNADEGKHYSEFSSDYVRFGNYYLRLTTSDNGGLAFVYSEDAMIRS